MNGLEAVELKPRSLFSRLFGAKDKSNATRAVRNLIATTPLSDLTSEQVEQCAAEYGVSVSDLLEDVRSVYADVLKHFASDRQLSEAELADLALLARVLALTDHDIRAVERVVLGDLYRNEFEAVAADGSVTEAELAGMRRLIQSLRIPDDLAVQIASEAGAALYRRVMEHAVEDSRLSPEEEAHLEALAKSLDLDVQLGNEARSQLERCKLLWRVDQGNLPTLSVPIHLQKKESCYAFISASHFEMRTRTRRIQYSGPTARIRIAKGLYWRVGDVAVNAVTENVMAPLGDGTLYLTSKRLLFDGSLKNTAIPLTRILDFTVFGDGIMIEKDSGKNQFFKSPDDLEVFAAVLSAALVAARP